MIEKLFRSKIQPILIDPIARICIHFHLSPLLLTFFSLVTGCLVFPFIFFNEPYFALFFLWISGLFDVLDGAVARLKNQVSPFGSVFDILSDRFVEFMVIAALLSIAPEERAFASLWMLGSILLCVSSFLVVGIFTSNQTEKSFYYSPGLMERAEAFFFFSFMILFSDFFFYLAWSFTALVFLTALIRTFEFFYHQRKVFDLD